MSDRFSDAVILDRQDLTDRIALFTIGRADGTPMPSAEAGSHLELRFGGADGAFLRHYSLIGPLTADPAIDPVWRIAVQREDRSRGSAYIHASFGRGTRIRVSPPMGAFRLGLRLPPVLLVAGGIGITPILPMLRSLRLRHQPVTMFYAGRSLSEMAFVPEIRAIGGDAVTIHISDTDGRPDLDALLAAQPEGTVVYACGPGPMTDALRKFAAARGWDADRIRSEVFNQAHRPQDTGFDVHTRSRGTVHVGPGTTILDALEAAGVDTLSDCRRGECGLCATAVTARDGALSHRDSYLRDADRAADRQMTICCSRVTGASVTLDI